MDGLYFTEVSLEQSSVTERKGLPLQIFGNDLPVEIKAYSSTFTFTNQYSKQ
jgi:hypothetical protein